MMASRKLLCCKDIMLVVMLLKCTQILSAQGELKFVTGHYNFESKDHCENRSSGSTNGTFIFVAACGHKIKLTIEAIETAETDNLFFGNGIEQCRNLLLDYSGGPDVNAITVVSQDSFLWLKYRIKDRSGFRGFKGYVDVISNPAETFECPAHYNATCGNTTCLSTKTVARYGFCFNNSSDPYNIKMVSNNSNTVALICDDGNVTLENGTPNSGVLQVRVHNKWFGVCAETWDQTETNVVCAQLGFPRSSSFSNEFYNSTHINGSYLESISCEGFEDTLKLCSAHVTKTPNCADDKIISIRCGDMDEGSVELVNRSDNFSGEVVFYYQGNWSYICRNEWTDKAANVVCKQVANVSMGYVAYNFFGDTAGKNGKQFAPLTFKCGGDEPSLNECQYEKKKCDKKDVVGVICKKSKLSNVTDNEVRLSGGEDEYSGYVEIWFNQEWCTVCDDAIKKEEANIICNQLKFGEFVDLKPPENTTKRNGTGPVMLSEINCNGKEQNILDCIFPSIGKLTTKICVANAYVTCSEPVVTDPNVPIVQGTAVTPLPDNTFVVILVSVLIVLCVAGMLWFLRNTIKKRLKRPLPPLPQGKFRSGSLTNSDSVYEEIPNAEDPYYMTPIRKEESDHSSEGKPAETVADVHASSPTDGDVTDRTEDESQQDTAASIDKNVSANLQHGGDSIVQTFPSNEDTLSASAEDNCYEINHPALKDEDGEDPGVFDDQTSYEVPSLDEEAQTNGSKDGVLLENRTYKDKDE